MIKKCTQSINYEGEVAFDRKQCLTAKQRKQACENIGVASDDSIIEFRRELQTGIATINETKSAVDATIDDVNAAVETANIASQLAISLVKNQKGPSLAQEGGLNGVDGLENSNTARMRTDFMDGHSLVKNIPLGYMYNAFYYDQDKTFVTYQPAVSPTVESVQLDYDGYVRFNFRNRSNTTLSPEEKTDFADIAIYEELYDNVNKNIDKLLQDQYSQIYSEKFNYGGINGDNGLLNERTDRAHSVLLSGCAILKNFPSNWKYEFFIYDLSGNYEYHSNRYTSDGNDIAIDFPNKQVRLNIMHISTSAPITEEDVASLNVTNIISTIKPNINEIVNSFRETQSYGTYNDALSINVLREITMPVAMQSGVSIGYNGNQKQFWLFDTSNDEGTDTASFYKCNFDENNHTITLAETLTHNLGHVNSCSYRKENDTFICGNGSSQYNDDAKIYVIENASEKTSFLREDAVVVNLNDLLPGYKVNAVWGEPNFGYYNIVYVILNDSHKFLKLMLGKGAVQLPNGVFIPGKLGTEFNGTYKVLENRPFGEQTRDYDNVVQGACYSPKTDKLYWGWGHANTNGAYVPLRCASFLTNNKLDISGWWVKKISTDGQTTIKANPYGVVCDNGYVYQFSGTTAKQILDV